MRLLKIASDSLNKAIDQNIWSKVLERSSSGASIDEVFGSLLGLGKSLNDFETFLKEKSLILVSQDHMIFFHL